ncbi:MAG: carboxypeptidase regulatory-like domain-containing protein, partial [Gemmatimonadota bacterium]
MTPGLAIVASLGLAFQVAPGTVEGVVRSADDGQPIAGAEIELVGTGRTTVADIEGRYVVEVPAGDHRLRARRFGFAPLIVELSVPTAGLIAVDFHL